MNGMKRRASVRAGQALVIGSWLIGALLLPGLAKADDSRYRVNADNRYLAQAMGQQAEQLDRNRSFRSKYPRDRYIVVGQASGMMGDGNTSGYCTAQFFVREYLVHQETGLIFVPFTVEFEGRVIRNLRVMPGYINEAAMMSECASRAMSALVEAAP